MQPVSVTAGLRSRQAEIPFLLCLWLLTVYSLLNLGAAPLSLLVNLALLATLYALGRPLNLAGTPAAPLLGFAAGLWVFQALCLIGLADWPYRATHSVGHYAFLTASHLILALCVLAGIAATAGLSPIARAWAVGNLGRYRMAFALTAAPVLVLAAATVARHASAAPQPWIAALAMAAVKAALTGVGEETFYRGVLQHAAVDRYGLRWGLVFQAACYAGFHLPLSQSLGPHPVFLFGLFALGLLFGIMTHLTKGIGWAAALHVGLDLVLEWRNIS